MNISENLKTKITNTILVIASIFIISCVLYTIYSISHKVLNPSPVKENKIDSLTTITDSLKSEVKHLDSIKNAKIIEIYNLDSDSTRKLFYRLVSE